MTNLLVTAYFEEKGVWVEPSTHSVAQDGLKLVINLSASSWRVDEMTGLDHQGALNARLES